MWSSLPLYEMSKFLIDENLPSKISLWNSSDFEFVTSSFQSESDSAIWEYAKANNLTIVTKDSDFSYRILTSAPPPKVIHIKFGNLRLKDFNALIEKQWDRIHTLSASHKLVNVFADRIEGVA